MDTENVQSTEIAIPAAETTAVAASTPTAERKTTAASENGQVVYTCCVKGCGRRGSAYEMFHIQPYGQPSVDHRGMVRNVVCGVCGEDAVNYDGDHMQVFPLLDTLHILVANAKRRAQEDQRKQGVNAFVQSLRMGSNGAVESIAPEEELQEFARERRRAAQAHKNEQRKEWEVVRRRAAGDE